MARRSRSLARRLALPVVSTLAAAALWAPMLAHPRATGFGDWQFFHHMWEAGYVGVWRYGEWPLWDPYHCGGVTLFGNPQSQLLSPFFALALVTDTTIALKLFVLAHAAAGLGGMYALARREGLGPLASGTSALLWCGSGFFAWHVAGGHAAFVPFYLAPLALLAFRRALDDRRYVVALAALMTLLLLEGAVYPFPYLTLLLAFDALAQVASARRPLRRTRAVLSALGLAGLLTALLGAIRLLPVAATLERAPRVTPLRDALTPAELLRFLTTRTHPWAVPGHPFVWPEYDAYLGWVALALALLGAVAALARRRRLAWIVGALVFGALALGAIPSLDAASPWALLHRLPVYDSLRVPSRFLVLATFYLALLAGLGLDAIARALGAVEARGVLGRTPPGALSRGVPALLALGLAVELLTATMPIMDRWHGPPIERAQAAARFHLTRAPYPEYAHFPERNVGSRGCYEAMPVLVAPGLWDGDVPQARVVGHPETAAGRVLDEGRTNNTVWADVDLARPAAVVFNQNYAPGWRLSEGSVGRVAVSAPRLTVELPAGRRRVTLRYLPPTLPFAVGLSALGAALCLLLLWRHRARPTLT
ncbi:MAG: hypothetical protein KC543_02960 [Myxococcales bacterium]|nr:hypothetical protein [Myxococcales bacterium]